MILRDFVCCGCGEAFEDLVAPTAETTPCPSCNMPQGGQRVFSGSHVGVASSASSSSSSPPNKASALRARADALTSKKKPAPSYEQRAEKHKRAEANLAREMVQHGNGKVTEKKAREMAARVSERVANRHGVT